MDDKTVKEIALTNLPNANRCALTGREVEDGAVMHRDLSDWWPSSLIDMRSEKLDNLLIVERGARDNYYAKVKRAGVVLSFSGGLDSTTVLHWCIRLFGEVHCLLFDYGQRHAIEIDLAEQYLHQLMMQDDLGCAVSFERIDMSPINNMAKSALTRSNIEVAADTPVEEMATGDLPATFVPGRNIYFITALAQAAYTRGWRHISMGVNVLDYSGYPDCRPEFIRAMREALGIGVFNNQDVAVHVPLMHLNKVQIIRLGMHLGVDYGSTHSCYNGVAGGCGACDSCILRRKAFTDLGLVDPAIEKQQVP